MGYKVLQQLFFILKGRGTAAYAIQLKLTMSVNTCMVEKHFLLLSRNVSLGIIRWRSGNVTEGSVSNTFKYSQKKGKGFGYMGFWGVVLVFSYSLNEICLPLFRFSIVF